MKRYIQGEERSQVTLLPECLDDYIAEDNAVRVVDVFVDELACNARRPSGMTSFPMPSPAITAILWMCFMVSLISVVADFLCASGE